MMVARSWSKHRLQPHRLKRYMSSNNLDFEQKAADTIGLYLNPSARGGVLRGREDGDSGGPQRSAAIYSVIDAAKASGREPY